MRGWRSSWALAPRLVFGPSRPRRAHPAAQTHLRRGRQHPGPRHGCQSSQALSLWL
jgi:hypothetical protein